jgi:putative acetyltransferase
VDIREDDLSGAKIRDLIAYHQRTIHADSPPGKSYTLGLSSLQAPDITVWSAWEGDALLGCGALKQLSPVHGEVKSMRTHPDHLRKGAAQALLNHMIAAARARGCTRLSLETGTEPPFAPAIALYKRNGFVAGAHFGDYAAHSANQFLHLDL